MSSIHSIVVFAGLAWATRKGGREKKKTTSMRDMASLFLFFQVSLRLVTAAADADLVAADASLSLSLSLGTSWALPAPVWPEVTWSRDDEIVGFAPGRQSPRIVKTRKEESSSGQ